MESLHTEESNAERLPYEKPVLRSISLVAEQVLGIGCKISGSMTINSGTVSCGISAYCYQDGS